MEHRPARIPYKPADAPSAFVFSPGKDYFPYSDSTVLPADPYGKRRTRIIRSSIEAPGYSLFVRHTVRNGNSQ